VRFRSRVLLPLVLALAAAGPALAAREWYDYYLQARDKDIPGRKWSDCVRNLREALRLRPTPATNVQTYGLQFVDYLPTTTSGSASRESRRTRPPSTPSTARSSRAPSRRRRSTPTSSAAASSQNAEAARITQRARREVQRLLREAQELGRRRAWDESLPLLAQAEVLARELDADTRRSVTQEQERQRTAQAEAVDAAARARRLEQRLADGERLLEEGKATEAKVAFDDALQLDPRNARALEGRRAADERIQASTTRAARLRALADGRSLFDAGQYEPALGPLTDACADPASAEGAEACPLLARARQVLEGLRRQKELRADIDALATRGEQLMAAAASRRRRSPSRAC